MTTDTLTPRQQALAVIRERLDGHIATIEKGPLEGTRYVPEAALDVVFSEALPPASEYGADVRTPARVIVSAVCPKCGQFATIRLEIGSELRVDQQGSTLRLKGKSKEASHTCGQTSMDLAEGQDSFELEDIVGDTPEDEAA